MTSLLQTSDALNLKIHGPCHSFGPSVGKDHTPDGLKTFKRDASKRLIYTVNIIILYVSVSVCFIFFLACASYCRMLLSNLLLYFF